MCIASQQLDSKRRRWMVLGNISLVFALIVWAFFARSGHGNHLWLTNWINAFCGLLFGFSIGINLLVLRKARRCRQA
jgi:hypothetical protein